MILLLNHPDKRGIKDHEVFKATIRSKINEEYIASEIARLTVGLFC